MAKTTPAKTMAIPAKRFRSELKWKNGAAAPCPARFFCAMPSRVSRNLAQISSARGAMSTTADTADPRRSAFHSASYCWVRPRSRRSASVRAALFGSYSNFCRWASERL
jgi:hypothetical protein